MEEFTPKVFYVQQKQTGSLKPNEDGIGWIGTAGLGPCIAFAVRNNDTKEVSLGHFDGDPNEVQFQFKKIEEMISSVTKETKNFSIYLSTLHGAKEGPRGNPLYKNIENLIDGNKFSEKIKVWNVDSKDSNESLFIDISSGDYFIGSEKMLNEDIIRFELGSSRGAKFETFPELDLTTYQHGVEYNGPDRKKSLFVNGKWRKQNNKKINEVIKESGENLQNLQSLPFFGCKI